MCLKKLFLVVAITSIFSPSAFSMDRPEQVAFPVVAIGPKKRIFVEPSTLRHTLKNLVTEIKDPYEGRYTIGASSIQTTIRVPGKIRQGMKLTSEENTRFLVCVAAQMKIDELGANLPTSIFSLEENGNVTYCPRAKTFNDIYGTSLERESLMNGFTEWLKALETEIKQSFRVILGDLDSLRTNTTNSKEKNELINFLKLYREEAEKGRDGMEGYPSAKVLKWFNEALGLIKSNQNITRKDLEKIQHEFIII